MSASYEKSPPILKKVEKPVKKDEKPLLKAEKPPKKDEKPPKKDEKPVKKEDNPPKKENNLPKKQEKPPKTGEKAPEKEKAKATEKKPTPDEPKTAPSNFSKTIEKTEPEKKPSSDKPETKDPSNFDATEPRTEPEDPLEEKKHIAIDISPPGTQEDEKVDESQPKEIYWASSIDRAAMSGRSAPGAPSRAEQAAPQEEAKKEPAEMAGGGNGVPPEPRRRRQHNQRHAIHMPRIAPQSQGTEISYCVKYTIFGFNVLFWLIGVAIFGIGVWAKYEKTVVSKIGDIGKLYLDPAWILIIAGAITFIVGFCGCIGALRENTILLCVYATILGILLLTQIGVAIMGFIFKDKIEEEMDDQLDDMIILYRDDPDLQSIIDWIQKDWLKCCGIQKPDDWDMNIYFNKSSVALNSPEAGGVPFSCCKRDENSPHLINYYCGHGVRKANYKGNNQYYQQGCLEAMKKWFNTNLMNVGIALVVVMVLEILGICFSQNLRSDIFAQKARWQYTH